MAYLGHQKRASAASLVGLHSALDSKFERDDLAHIIVGRSEFAGLNGDNHRCRTDAGVDPGRCHALALKFWCLWRQWRK